jgi:hypothetical protein
MTEKAMTQLTPAVKIFLVLITALIEGDAYAQSGPFCDGSAPQFRPAGRTTVYVGRTERVYRICKCENGALAQPMKIYADGALVDTFPAKVSALRCVDVGGKKIEIELEDASGGLGYRAVPSLGQ